MNKQVIITRSWYSVFDCEMNKDTIFVFGDNCMRIGKGGQATIRDCHNAFGVITKIAPSMGKKDFFNDKNYDANCKMINDDLLRIVNDTNYTKVCFPYDGLGTGLSKLPELAPKTFNYLSMRLFELFDITTTSENKLVIL